ncbi:hypothetical protein PsorP6_004909 [Peronosclerospora sorghi]|uniref:Uncharacterized protein n=1 Tax=Peronosclerospora sorghi TaxID=230839 RepID=A0ACC0W4I2_9STRA|nr:hypothetical protein PsorP6_004909 [Peronosclerospora sorghi]
MHTVAPILFVAAAVSTASAHDTYHSYVFRILQTEDSSMNMSSMNMSGKKMSGMDMASSTSTQPTNANTTSDKDFKCPVCGMSTKDMGYDNLSHMDLTNGQRVYTCGMTARSFDGYDTDLTDTVYLSINVAEFIVNSSDATEYAKCNASCDECSNGIKDPVTGDDVTSSNYQYVCLKKGQKIYFASAASKNEYLSKVNSKPRYLVDHIICENAPCPNAENVTLLSAAAKSFVPELATRNSSGGSETPSTSGSAVSSKFLPHHEPKIWIKELKTPTAVRIASSSHAFYLKLHAYSATFEERRALWHRKMIFDVLTENSSTYYRYT